MQFCIHGHFYQPPREDPISNYIPDEKGAEPFNNWNERILAECYAPNAYSGNFERISFNIGPTLFNWMWETKPEIAKMIVDQERKNFQENGVGNGLAQSYNHIILPLANLDEKFTQVRWGIADFEYRFGHRPEGIWLPETAVDNETLMVLSDCGLKFTITAPWQVETAQGKPGPYHIELPGKREPFVVFAYNRELSTQVSFLPKSTENGDHFIQNMLNSYENDRAELTILASDGELYGHHQPFRDYFLTYILGEGSRKHAVNWSYPGLWLAENHVENFAQLVSPSSWSCMHGVARWTEECDCTPGATWKSPLRNALNQIAEWIDQIYLDILSPLIKEPFELRDRYIEIINHQVTLRDLLRELAETKLSEQQEQQIDLLLKAQFERLRMFTSCGWFFEEFHRIEPQNNIAYAAKAVWLTQKATGLDLSLAFMDTLKKVKSNKTGLRADTVFSQTLIRARAENQN